MSLPDEHLIPSMRTAIDVYPGNALPTFALTILPPQEVAVLTSNWWGPKPRTLSVQFLDNPTPTFRRMFLEAANSWDCCITFAETVGQGEVRLSRNARGYWSYLGTDILHVPPGRATINLQGFTENTRSSEWARVPAHEVGHTLGMPHEHLRRAFVERIDRQKAYSYFLRTQGWGKDLVDVNVLTPLEEVALLRPTPPDQMSIMTYSLPAEIMVDGVGIVGGVGLTATDLAYVDDIYPLPPGPGPTPPVTPPTTSTSDLVLAEINRRRASSNLSPLAADPKLEALAIAWAGTMAATGILTHGDSAARIAAVYPGRASGEIIAAGQTSPGQVADDWMASPGHRAQILGPYTMAGCGSATSTGSDAGTRYWAVDFVDGPPTAPTPPVEPPKPPNPPVQPPETKEFGPYPLRVGVESDRFTMIPGASVLFAFKAPRKGAYAAATRGTTPLRMELLGAYKAVLASDDDASGVGPNAMIAKSLAKGSYFLRIRGMTPEDRGNYRVKVMAFS